MAAQKAALAKKSSSTAQRANDFIDHKNQNIAADNDQVKNCMQVALKRYENELSVR
jgi:hypothetical protein